MYVCRRDGNTLFVLFNQIMLMNVTIVTIKFKVYDQVSLVSNDHQSGTADTYWAVNFHWCPGRLCINTVKYNQHQTQLSHNFSDFLETASPAMSNKIHFYLCLIVS